MKKSVLFGALTVAGLAAGAAAAGTLDDVKARGKFWHARVATFKGKAHVYGRLPACRNKPQFVEDFVHICNVLGCSHYS